jgi:uncharacterized Fe-S cluster protein YjdI
MINDIIVIDDFLPNVTQNKLEELFTSSKLSWIFFKDIALSSSEIKRLGITKLTPGIACYVKQDNPKFVNELLLNEVKIIPIEACKKIGSECKEIYNARSFMHFPLDSKLRKEYDNIHIDIGYEHLVCLYYVNDTDGDTFLFNKTKKDGPIPNDGKLEILKRVSPKKGRAVLFDGSRYHSSSGPSKDIRCIINFNIKI